MQTLSHITYPALTYTILTRVTPIPFSTPVLVTLMVASTLPDLDVFYHTVVRNKKIDDSFCHHQWPTHWPVTYLPFIILTALTRNYYSLMITLGIYSHFVLDCFFVGDGIMWLYPISKKPFSRLSKRTEGHHGMEWIRIYKTLPIFKLDILCFLILIILLLLPR